MDSFSTAVITFFAVLTVLGQAVIVLLLLNFLFLKFNPKNKQVKKINSLVSEYFVIVVLTITTIATIGSLTFSEILDFTPCKLCWYQRILMYPQVVIAGIALLTNDTKIKKYILSLSVVGLSIAIYHVLLQFFPEILKCSDEVAKCSAKQFATFGYITIPVMSATAFMMLLLFCLTKQNSSKN